MWFTVKTPFSGKRRTTQKPSWTPWSVVRHERQRSICVLKTEGQRETEELWMGIDRLQIEEGSILFWCMFGHLNFLLEWWNMVKRRPFEVKGKLLLKSSLLGRVGRKLVFFCVSHFLCLFFFLPFSLFHWVSLSLFLFQVVQWFSRDTSLWLTGGALASLPKKYNNFFVKIE